MRAAGWCIGLKDERERGRVKVGAQVCVAVVVESERDGEMERGSERVVATQRQAQDHYKQ
jgi:hypothetical protein